MQNLIAAAATEVHTVLRTTSDGVAITTEFLRDVGVIVAHALAMRWIVCPVVATAAIDVVDVDVAIDVDVVAAPIHTAAPIAPSGPAAERVAGTEGEAGRKNAGADIGGRRPVVGRVGWGRPRSIDHRGIVIGNIDGVGLRRRDRDDLFPVLLLR